MKKYKVGYIQGVFDMFHIGHLNLFKNAKTICDYLIVAVNSDELTKSYKNVEPVMTAEERLAIISELRCVDKAIIVNDRDKIKALEEFHYDALIMGSDWKGTDFYNKVEEELKKRGADVVYFDYTQHISSTIIRNKLNKE